jgi:hypothetical protein
MFLCVALSAGLVGACVVPPPTLADYGVDTEIARVDTADTSDSDVDTDVTPAGPVVLLLDDGASGGQIVPALEESGLQVVDGPDYYDWDGVSPSLDGVDVVVLLQGATEMPRLMPAADQGLRDFVMSGGGLVRTERALASLEEASPMLIDAALPVTSASGFADAQEWWVDDRDHPIVAGLPAKWDEPGTISLIEAVPEGEVVMSSANQVPLLTLRTDLGGRVVHINHDLTRTTSTMGPEILQLMVSTTSWAAE